MKSFVSLFVKHLGVVIRELLDQRGLSQKELCARIRMSEPSLSNIMTGRAKPRQVNLLRIMQELCVTPEEEQRVLAAFDIVETKLPDRPEHPEDPTPSDEVERVRRYLRVKAESVLFLRKVAKSLDGIAVDYHQDFIKEDIICDFYLPTLNTGIECKYNINRDWDREVTTVAILRKELGLDHVIVAVPRLTLLARQAAEPVRRVGGVVCLVSQMGRIVRRLLEGGSL